MYLPMKGANGENATVRKTAPLSNLVQPLKLGKSILLDELLKADEVEYTDVSQHRFWIVVPPAMKQSSR